MSDDKISFWRIAFSLRIFFASDRSHINFMPDLSLISLRNFPPALLKARTLQASADLILLSLIPNRI